MPVTPTYPGVYVEELPSGAHPITGVATSIGAFVDFFPQGPLNEAIQIFSWADFERQFGGLDVRSEASYGIQQFFLNGGTQAFVVRTTSTSSGSGAQAAAIALQDGNGNNVLLATAASPGQWGNNIRVDVDYATTDPTSLFNLTVTEVSMASGTPQVVATEPFRNLSLDSTQSNFAVNVINNGSQLVTVQLPSSGAARPAPTGTVSKNFVAISVPSWSAHKAFAAGAAILDPNGNLEVVLNAGTSGASMPSWPTTVGSKTSDGTVGWQLSATGVGIPTWAAAQHYAVGAQIVDSNGHLEIATTASTSGATQPVWPTAVGTITAGDGGVSWQLAPTGLGLVRPAWTASKNYILGAEIIDTNGNLERVTTAGTSGAASPAWKMSIGGTVTDGTVTWTLVAGNRLVVDLTDSMQVAVNGNPAFTKVIQLNAAPPTALNWTWLAATLQASIRAIDPSLANATVTVDGSASTEVSLQIKAGTPGPADYLVFSDGSGTLATTLGLNATAAPNVQQYALGSSTKAQAQAFPPAAGNAEPGSDGKWSPSADAAGVTGGLIGDPVQKTGMYALLEVDLFNILCIPSTALLPDINAAQVATNATALCTQRRAFYILDAPQQAADRDTVPAIMTWLDQNATLRSRNVAIYFPRPDIADPLNNYQLRATGPSGTVAGLYARTDVARGVWKAPAGTETALAGVQALEYNLIDGENGVLNPLAINCLRSFPIYGNICWGARTLNGADQMEDDYKYIPVRRLALFLEESLYRGLKWVVFEPNDEPLWALIRLNVTAFMQNLFRQGAFQGSTPQQAYLVKCDSETTTPLDQANGIVNILVGFAPLKPAEFVIIQIQQLAGQLAA
jgi:phage tail sheath protein FI